MNVERTSSKGFKNLEINEPRVDINSLPPELVEIIFQNLPDIKSLCLAGSVCKQYRQLAFGYNVLTHLFFRKLPKTTNSYLEQEITREELIKQLAAETRLCGSYNIEPIMYKLGKVHTWSIEKDKIIAGYFNGEIKILNFNGDILDEYHPHEESVTEIKVIPNKIITGSFGDLAIWDLEKKSFDKLPHDCSIALECTPQNQIIIASDSVVSRLDDSGNLISSLTNLTSISLIKVIGTQAIIGFSNGNVGLWDYENDSFKIVALHRNTVSTILNIDSLIITGSHDGTISILDLNKKSATYLSEDNSTKECLLQEESQSLTHKFLNILPFAHRSPLYQLYLTDDKRLASLDYERKLCIWDIESATLVQSHEDKTVFFPMEGKYLTRGKKSGLKLLENNGALIKSFESLDNQPSLRRGFHFQDYKLFGLTKPDKSNNQNEDTLMIWDFAKKS